MATPFKNYLSHEFLANFSQSLKEHYSDFNSASFLSDVFDTTYDDLELKQRMRHITLNMAKQLPNNYKDAIDIIIKASTTHHKKDLNLVGIEFIFLPDFIEVFGLDSFNVSINAMEEITSMMSCEFAVRPFIVKYGDKMIKKMQVWSGNENHHIRRLSSEGCRPRLPWAMALPDFKKDPSPILPILENLKNDPSEYVRRSVANNLNDISKDNPHITMDMAKKWHGQSKETDALVKHGLRSLLKSNYPGALSLIGYGNPTMLESKDFKVLTPEVKEGASMRFSFSVKNKSSKSMVLRLEYAIYFRLANGKEGRKVFKISEREIEGEKCLTLQRKHSFRQITTRTYYKGQHSVSLILNGIEKGRHDFRLT